MAITGNGSISITLNDPRTLGLQTNVNIGVNGQQWKSNWTEGSGAGQFNKVWHQTRTFGGSPDDLDLAGVLQDAAGQGVSFTRLVLVYIVNLSLTNTITVGNAAANPVTSILGATGTVTIRSSPNAAQGYHSKIYFEAADATGYAVTAGTADQFRVSGTSGQQYAVILAGS